MIQLNASSRLLQTAAMAELFMMKAAHLKKAKYTPAQLAEEETNVTLYAYTVSKPTGPARKIFVLSHGISKSSDKVGDRSRVGKDSAKLENLITIDAKGKIKGKNDVAMDEARPMYVFK